MLDLLVIAPHPDDAELHCGGLLLKMAHSGYRTGIVDLSRGEMGTRGSVAERNEESAAASKILGVEVRINLDLPDSQIGRDPDHLDMLIEAIRAYRPGLLLIPHTIARHPDHSRAATLAGEASFLAGLEKIRTTSPAFRPRQVISYYTYYTYKDEQPSFIVDITSHFEDKMEAVKAYKSQFFNPESSESETFISRPEFFDEIRAQNGYFGSLIGVKYGEPFIIREYLSIDDPVSHFK